MSIQKELFGKTAEGAAVDLYTLTNAHGLRVKIMTYGATIISVETPDRTGKFANVTLALDSLQDYLHGHPCLGSTIGRFANRIAKGKFTLDGVAYTLATNNGPNHLHGGIRGFDKVVWQAQPVESPTSSGVKFSYQSADGEEGYPGNLLAEVTYSLTDDNELKMEYAATTDKPTIVNLTNHAYWNLSGAAAGDILAHQLTIHADKYLPADAGLIPLGELRDMAQSPLDFTTPHAVGARIGQVEGGYDHCYVVNHESPGSPLKKGTGSERTREDPAKHGSCEVPVPLFQPAVADLALAARVAEPTSGRVMEIYTTQPGIQFYTANGLNGTLTHHGHQLQKHAGLCLETQHYPDSPNQLEFPSTRLNPGEKYEQVTVHRFLR